MSIQPSNVSTALSQLGAEVPETAESSRPAASIAASRISEFGRSRMARFAIVGLFSNFFLLMILLVLIRAGFGAVPATVLVYTLGVTSTYFINRVWSFRSDAAHLKAGPRYILVHVLCAGTLAILQFLGHDQLGLNAMLIQIFGMIMVVVPLFVAIERFAFGMSTDRQ